MCGRARPRGRHPLDLPHDAPQGGAIGLVLFTLIWCGITYALYEYTDAPLLFPAAFAFFAVLLLLGCVQLCLSRQILDLKAGQLEARLGLFGMKGPYTYTGEELESLEIRNAGTQGQNAIYSLHITNANGKKRKLVGQIKSRPHADALLSHIRAHVA